MTSSVNSQLNSRNSFLPSLPMYFFDDHAHRFAFVLDAGVQRAEIRDGAEEYAADQHPEQNRKPAENRSLNRAGNGAAPAMELNWWLNTVQPFVGT